MRHDFRLVFLSINRPGGVSNLAVAGRIKALDV